MCRKTNHPIFSKKELRGIFFWSFFVFVWILFVSQPGFVAFVASVARIATELEASAVSVFFAFLRIPQPM